MTFISLISLIDEIKSNVSKEIEDCKRSGIEVKMMTQLDTEVAGMLAEKCGIIGYQNEKMMYGSDRDDGDVLFLKPGYGKDQVLNAQEYFRKYINHKQLNNLLICPTLQNSYPQSTQTLEYFTVTNDLAPIIKLVNKSSVISRARAIDKLILVAALKKSNAIVAVTGDGVSDSLALQMAHVGISLGKNSTDLSKEAADLILMDDDFKSIITAIVYGRNIFDSVRKCLQFILTSNISILSLILISSIPLVDFYFHPNQLLWLNIIVEALGSLSLSSEQPDRDSVFSRKPYKMNAKLITKSMKLKIIAQSGIQIGVIVFLIFFAPDVFGCTSDRGTTYRKWSVSQGVH